MPVVVAWWGTINDDFAAYLFRWMNDKSGFRCNNDEECGISKRTLVLCWVLRDKNKIASYNSATSRWKKRVGCDDGWIRFFRLFRFMVHSFSVVVLLSPARVALLSQNEEPRCHTRMLIDMTDQVGDGECILYVTFAPFSTTRNVHLSSEKCINPAPKRCESRTSLDFQPVKKVDIVKNPSNTTSVVINKISATLPLPSHHPQGYDRFHCYSCCLSESDSTVFYKDNNKST
jgi:hypothetical protein